MSLNRLTKRAKFILSDLEGVSNIDVGVVLDSMQNTSGLASLILRNIPGLNINRARAVNMDNMVEEAYYHALKLGHVYVGTEHLLLALASLTNSPDFELIKRELVKLSTFPHSGDSHDSQKTPLLDTFGENLTSRKLSSARVDLVYREEIEDIIAVLLQKEDFNPLIVGDYGVGKRTLVELLVNQIQLMEVPPALVDYEVIEFDLIGFITSISNREGLEYGLATLLEELRSFKKVILYIKDVQNIFISTNVGLTVPLLFNILKSDLQTAGIPMITIINNSFYDKVSSENDQIFDGFALINVNEPSEEITMEILAVKSAILGAHHNVKIPSKVFKHAYEATKRELKQDRFPKKALEILDQACANLLVKEKRVPDSYKELVSKEFLLRAQINKLLDNSDYDSALQTRTKLRRLETRLKHLEEDLFVNSDNEAKLTLSTKDIDYVLFDVAEDAGSNVTQNLSGLSNLSSQLKKKLIGQNHAVDTVAKALIRGKLGLRAKKRPLGNFLFLGSTGVGKTELAKLLAAEAFGPHSLIRLDMSDFGEKHTIARLVGAPPGYIGYGEGGELTTKIDANPNSVVLFDEIEKAHHDVLNILLQIMEEGELVDAKGITFDFSNAVVILTSNLGTKITHENTIGFDTAPISDDRIEKHLRNNLKKILKPELINRFDEVIVFKKLKKVDQKRILNVLLKDVLDHLKKQGIKLKVTAEAKKLLLEKGYSDEYGARTLRRTIESELLDSVAEIILNSNKRPLNLTAQAKEDYLEININS